MKLEDYCENIKRRLSYVLKNKRGYKDELISAIGQENVEKFENFGFINTSHARKREIWRMTDLAKEYYISEFGRFSYLWLKFKRS